MQHTHAMRLAAASVKLTNGLMAQEEEEVAGTAFLAGQVVSTSASCYMHANKHTSFAELSRSSGLHI